MDDFVLKVARNDVMFMDYFVDNRFTNEYFQNSFMLNSAGAKKFTEIVLKEAEVIK